VDAIYDCDVVARPTEWRRLSVEESHTRHCVGCGELADWINNNGETYCNSCGSEQGAPQEDN